MDSPSVEKAGVARCKIDPGSAGHVRMSRIIALPYAQFFRRVPALLRAWHIFKLAIREKCDPKVDAGVLLHSFSFQNFAGRQKLRVSVPFAVVRLRGVVEVLGIVKQRHFTGDVTDYGNDAVVSDKFQQLQQIIFARAGSISAR